MSEHARNGWLRLAELPTKLTPEESELHRELTWANQDPEVKRKYPDEIVAVHRRQIIAHGDDLKTVLDEAQRITGLPRHLIAVTTIIGPKQLFGDRN
jgi:hypothetical protein